ncbi:hypothetical protein J5N58_20425 [Rhizobium cremeum]|jgi:hypothetical protein|uniref:hypothetical protein n=1 Tax=Rhizobium cremeum TaxID=2813827 RepID=UPI001FD047C6|nr:hypothetical protein [Rhizobium cremeum]MCJ7996833.1 hypothetical protein [Rhizobium cremeum]MCJ8002051.1 hypothetical protein [Rhizobium cremeum]
MNVISLRSDCERCAALCCVGLAFDRSDLFAIDKEAGSPCPNLNACGRCRIHSNLADVGFRGCVQYDCLGAGQRVVQDFFGGKSWLENADLLAPMMEAFWVTRIAHEHLELLEVATSFPLSRHQEDRRRMLFFCMIDAGLSVTRVRQVAHEVMGWLKELSGDKE